MACHRNRSLPVRRFFRAEQKWLTNRRRGVYKPAGSLHGLVLSRGPTISRMICFLFAAAATVCPAVAVPPYHCSIPGFGAFFSEGNPALVPGCPARLLIRGCGAVPFCFFERPSLSFSVEVQGVHASRLSIAASLVPLPIGQAPTMRCCLLVLGSRKMSLLDHSGHCAIFGNDRFGVYEQVRTIRRICVLGSPSLGLLDTLVPD